MISESRILELIALGNENRNLDYKGAFSWAVADNDAKCELVKDVLAFANTRDGGIILVGVNNKSGELEGLSDDEFSSFDQTKFNDFVGKYTEPRHVCRVHRRTLGDKKLVAIEIPEFADVPVLCKCSVQSSSKPLQLILRKAGLYKRTDKATSELIEDSGEMRELLNRGLLRRQDELFSAFKLIVQPGAAPSSSESRSGFTKEIEEGREYFGEIDGGELLERPHWLVSMQPESYVRNRIARPLDIQQHVQDSAVSLRWPFPMAGRSAASPWSNFGGGSQSFYSSQLHRIEAFRAYHSGLVLWCAGVAEDVWPAFHDKHVLSAISVIYSSTEWALFAKRYYESVLPLGESVTFRVELTGAQDRTLIGTDSRISFDGSPQSRVEAMQVEESTQVADLRSEAEALARRLARRVFELFNWNNPSEELLERCQQDFLTGRH